MKNFLIIFLLFPFCMFGQKSVIDIDFSQKPKQLNNFWNSTGFSPADIVERNEMKRVLQDIGKLPENAIKYIRPHYLLNLVEVKGMETGNPIYNWTKLDLVLDEFTKNGLKLIFEIMGFPSDGTDNSKSQYDKNFQEQLVHRKSYFDNLKDPEQIKRWQVFVKDLALHLENKYGREEIHSWFFESTNEPDRPNFWKYDIPTYLNYYDACSEGLKEADPEIVFGGPGTASANDLNEMFTSFLAHCDTGRNYFTGETGVRLDFISVHVKDSPQKMINRELKTFDYIKKHHPKFISKPFINDESDPIVGWATPYWWETGAWYAAFITQNIDLHQRIIIDSANINYRLFSSDHTFMGDWYQRTTHALFRNQPDSNSFVLIKKPVLTVMELIAELGNKYVDVKIPKDISPFFGIIPTIKKDTLAILVYNKTEFQIIKGAKPEPDFETALMEKQIVNTQLRFKGIKSKTATIRIFNIDQTNGNPFNEWIKMGKPNELTKEQSENLRKAEKPVLVKSETIYIKNSEYLYQLTAKSPSVSLILIIMWK